MRYNEPHQSKGTTMQTHVAEVWDTDRRSTRYAPLYWMYDPYAPAEPPQDPTATPKDGAVILLVNRGWLEHYTESRFGTWANTNYQIHQIELVVPAPEGLTQEVLDTLTEWLDAWTDQERAAFFHYNNRR